MAFYQANIQIDTTGTGPAGTEKPTTPIVSATLIRFQLSQNYVDYTGTFEFNGQGGQLSGGTVTSVISYAGVGGPTTPATFLESFEAGTGEIFDPVQMLTLIGEKFSAYVFQNDDVIVGSVFDDKLAAFAGEDNIFGGAGNDKLYGGGQKDVLSGDAGNDKIWGGGGKDVIFYGAEGGKDRIKDLNLHKDSVIISRDFASNMKALADVAEQQGNKVVLDFGGVDKLIIDNLDVDHLNEVSFSFLDI